MEKIMLVVIIISMVLISSCAMPVANEAQTQDAINAIHIAEKCLIDNKIQIENYKLIKVENLYINNSKYIGPNKWYVIFKSKDLIPENSKCLIGKGGEIFIEVDINNIKAKILGYGE